MQPQRIFPLRRNQGTCSNFNGAKSGRYRNSRQPLEGPQYQLYARTIIGPQSKKRRCSSNDDHGTEKDLKFWVGKNNISLADKDAHLKDRLLLEDLRKVFLVPQEYAHRWEFAEAYGDVLIRHCRSNLEARVFNVFQPNAETYEQAYSVAPPH
ncbi:hypothetical protein BDD12DRAFT_286450 [Trichophaea hybrida]|nr:hypothetical protein BDD12DRAFT_286450 [Trichophaea hybrida]